MNLEKHLEEVSALAELYVESLHKNAESIPEGLRDLVFLRTFAEQLSKGIGMLIISASLMGKMTWLPPNLVHSYKETIDKVFVELYGMAEKIGQERMNGDLI